MKIVSSLLGLLLLAGGGYYAYHHFPQVQGVLQSKIGNAGGQFYTFKPHLMPQEIVEKHQKELLKGPSSKIADAKVLFLPHVLMEVKFSQNQEQSAEGILLWSLVDGEMVLDTTDWKTTHGFEDCINARADKNDFRLLTALVEGGGSMEKEKLYQKFKVESDIVDKWIESCKTKKLVVVSGGKLRLHFQNPNLVVQPMTRVEESLVSMPVACSKCPKKKYSMSQIEHFTALAFGPEFAIRTSREVYLPIYAIPVEHSDGSVLTTYWNGITGKRLSNNFELVVR